MTIQEFMVQENSTFYLPINMEIKTTLIISNIMLAVCCFLVFLVKNPKLEDFFQNPCHVHCLGDSLKLYRS